jgi:hypothetical protein
MVDRAIFGNVSYDHRTCGCGLNCYRVKRIMKRSSSSPGGPGTSWVMLVVFISFMLTLLIGGWGIWDDVKLLGGKRESSGKGPSGPTQDDIDLLPASCNSSAGEICKSSHSGDWPFTVDRGWLSCKYDRTLEDGSIVGAALFYANGTTFALNGVAQSRGYPPIDPIWRDSDQIPGTKVPLGESISLALRQCRSTQRSATSEASRRQKANDSIDPPIDFQRCVVVLVKAFNYSYEDATKECSK